MAHSKLSTPVSDAASSPWKAERSAIDGALGELCRSCTYLIGPPVSDAVRYSLLGGGKRLRGLLFLAAYRAAGGKGAAQGLAAAIEIVHAYSLVHDDLPCMDDDS